jgi:hypothetical protein
MLNNKQQKPVIVIFNRTESIVESIMKDIITFLVLFTFMCVSVNMGSVIWSIIAILIIIVFLFNMGLMDAKKNRVLIFNKKQAINWANSLPDDQSNLF